MYMRVKSLPGSLNGAWATRASPTERHLTPYVDSSSVQPNMRSNCEVGGSQKAYNCSANPSLPSPTTCRDLINSISRWQMCHHGKLESILFYNALDSCGKNLRKQSNVNKPKKKNHSSISINNVYKGPRTYIYVYIYDTNDKYWKGEKWRLTFQSQVS